MHAGGISLKAIAKNLGVDDHTAAKALRWFRERRGFGYAASWPRLFSFAISSACIPVPFALLHAAG